MHAKKFCEKTSKPEACPGENYNWLHGKLWMGDELMGELLVMRFEAKIGVTEGFSLQAT